jgi:protein O-mannosyl-transferase
VLLLCEGLWWTPGRSMRTLATTALLCAAPLAWWAWQRAVVLGASAAAEFPFTDNPIVGATFWQGRLTAIQVMWRYMALMAWPAHLSNDYSYAQVPLANGTAIDWLACALLVGGTLAAMWQFREQRAVVFYAAFALIVFVPASNLLFATGTIMGERLVYLPSAGLAALVAIGLNQLATSGARRRMATAAAAAVIVACGARTFARNPDWTNDVTLWRTAVAAAPASAKAHRALAEALYYTDPTHANIDEVIAEADRSVALLDVLPDEQNTFQAFRQAGAYYLDKANRVVEDTQGNTNPELRRLYSRSLNLLDRAVMIARAGASRLPGGSREPEADAQRLRAAAILGLQNPSLALVAAKRSRELAPAHPLAYHLSAAALLEMQRGEEAAMTLLTGSIGSGDTALRQEAMTLYQRGLDPDGCAVSGSGATAALNPNCPIVRRHSCVASAAAYQILKKAGQPGRAEQVKAAAVTGLACPADLMDRPNSLVP